MYKIMPYFSSSLAYVSHLAQRADTHILLLGFLGKGQSRYALLCAFRSMPGASCSARALCTHQGRVRQPGYGDIPWGANHCSCLVLPCSWFLHQGCSTQGFLLCLSSRLIYSSHYLPQAPLCPPL